MSHGGVAWDDVPIRRDNYDGQESVSEAPPPRPHSRAAPGPVPADLEDAYLRLKEENAFLKQHIHDLEDKGKRMATKLAKLTADLEKYRQGDVDLSVLKHPSKRNPEMESALEDLRNQVRDLKKKNEQLTNKLAYARSTASTQSNKRRGAYDHVAGRTDHGKRIVPAAALFGSAAPAFEENSPPPRASSPERGSAKEQKLEDLVRMLRERLGQAEVELRRLKDDNDHLRENGSGGSSLDLLRLREEVKAKSAELATVKAQFDSLESRLLPLQEEDRRREAVIADLKAQLREEQSKTGRSARPDRRVELLEGEIGSLKMQIDNERAEKELVSREYKALLSNGLFSQKEKEAGNRMNEMGIHLDTLRTKLTEVNKENAHLLQRINALNQENEEMRAKRSAGEVRQFELQVEKDKLNDQLQAYLAAGMNLGDLQEALTLVQRKKERALSGKAPAFVIEVEGVKNADEATASLVRELDKVNKMLAMREQMAADAKATCDALNRDMELMRKEYDDQLAVYAQQLDRKNARIARLEEALYAVPGRKNARRAANEAAEEDAVGLAADENLFEVTIERAELTGRGLDPAMASFFAYDFYEHETAVTNTVVGLTPVFNHTAQFVIKLDDFFFTYMETSTLVLELHRARGMDYIQEGQVALSFDAIMRDRSGKPVSFDANIFAVDDPERTIIGTVHYSLRMLRPMTEAMAVHAQREQIAALDPLRATTNLAQRYQGRRAAMAPKNTLTVRVLKASGLRPGAASHLAACVFYQLYDNETHHTTVVEGAAGSTLAFNDDRSFPVAVLPDFDEYMRTKQLEFTLFDARKDTADANAFLGVAFLNLSGVLGTLSLAKDIPILDANDDVVGNLTVELAWASPYVAPAVEKDDANKTAKSVRPPNPTITTSTLDDSRPVIITPAPIITAPPAATASSSPDDERGPALAQLVRSMDVDPEQAIAITLENLQLNGEMFKLCKGDLQIFYEVNGEWGGGKPVNVVRGANPCIVYDSKQVFNVPFGSAPRRQLRQELLRPREADAALVEFCIFDVGVEPPLEIGAAFLSLPEMCANKKDLRGEKLAVVGVEGAFDNKEMGSLMVTVKAMEAMLSMMDEDDSGHRGRGA